MPELIDKRDFVQSIMVNLTDQSSETRRVVESAIWANLNDVDITRSETAIVVADTNENTMLFQKFFIAKKVQGLTDKSLRNYKSCLSLIFGLGKPVTQITTDDIRYLLAVKQLEGWTASNANNYRRVWSSFFGWLQREEYIRSNPMARIDKIKEPKIVKKPFTESEVERMRRYLYFQSDSNQVEKGKKIRNIAIFEVLISTGMRVSELTSLKVPNKNDDLETMIVFGKGQKERTVYLNAKAILAVQEWLKWREEKGIECRTLFCSILSPHAPLEISGVEIFIRGIGRSVDVNNTHPHRFRRTAATWALKRGMPIDQVRQMLGHEQMATTTIYAKAEMQDVKANHDKYLT